MKMELLEFKNKILNLCNVTDVKEIGGVLMNAVLKNNIDFFNGYNSIIDDTKDWLQALWQYYEADRMEKKQDYTPKSLCKLVSVLANDCKSVYDCCGGSGALTIEVLKNHNVDSVYVEELDERVIPFLLFNLCLYNTAGYVVNGDVLTGKIKKAYFLNKGDTYSTCEVVKNVDVTKMMDIAISNPPYNIKWEPPLPLEACERFPVIPPSSNANYAFALHCLFKTKKRAVLILPNSVCTSAQDLEVRKYLIENDLIESIVTMPEKMFEATDISTCIMILNKSKKYRGRVILIDSRKNCTTETREQNGQFGGKSHTGRTYKKTYNVLSDDNINQILDAIENSKEIIGFSKVIDNEGIAENNYCFQPSTFFDIQLDSKENHRSYEDIVNDLNYIIRMRNSCKLVINESLAKELNFDTETYKKAIENSKENTKNIKAILSLDLLSDDYISFTKNKNEICFKSNDKEVLSHLFKFFIMRWSQDLDLLNTMENRFLAELRDALIPDLLSGKIDVDNVAAENM